MALNTEQIMNVSVENTRVYSAAKDNKGMDKKKMRVIPCINWLLIQDR